MGVRLKNVDEIVTSGGQTLDVTAAVASASSGGGGTESFVASGAISANDGLVLNSDGTVSTVSSNVVVTDEELTAEFSHASSLLAAGFGQNYFVIDTCRLSSTKMGLLIHDTQGNTLWLCQIDLSTGTQVFSKKVIVTQDGSSTFTDAKDAIIDTYDGNQLILCIYKLNQAGLHLISYSVDSNGDFQWTGYKYHSTDSNVHYSVAKASLAVSDNYFFLTATKDGTGYLYCDSYALTNGNTITGSSSKSQSLNLRIGGDLCTAVQKRADGGYFVAVNCRRTGTSGSSEWEQQSSVFMGAMFNSNGDTSGLTDKMNIFGYANYAAAAFDTQNQKFVILSNSNYEGKAFKISYGEYDKFTGVVFHTVIVDNRLSSFERHCIAYDESTDTYLASVKFLDETSGSWKTTVFKIQASRSGIDCKIIQEYNFSGNWCPVALGQGLFIQGRAMNLATGSEFLTHTYQAPLEVGTTDVSEFIGYAKDSASDGDTVDVTIKSGVHSFSGATLTPNADYHIAHDGTLSSFKTPHGVAGKALSSTKLQLR